MRFCACSCAYKMSPFQSIKTWKGGAVPDYEAKAKRVQELYDIAAGKAEPREGDPEVVICFDFGPLSVKALQAFLMARGFYAG